MTRKKIVRTRPKTSPFMAKIGNGRFSINFLKQTPEALRPEKLIYLIVVAVFCGIAFKASGFAAKTVLKERVFSVEEKIFFKNLPKNIGELSVWIPYPVSDNWQAIDGFKLTTSFEKEIFSDAVYGNKIIYLKPRDKRRERNLPVIILSFKARRKEYKTPQNLINYGKVFGRFLKPDMLVPVNAQMRQLALDIVKGRKGDLERARALYDYIIDELTYSKDDPKICGIGDPLLTLKHKKGICTDYHSLFISLARSLRIPVKFEIGFKIPPDRIQAELNGYHCWAKFYLQDKGWVAVDISEADKYPQKRDYYFGAIDENKLHLTTGRDIKLKYARDAQPLNFFVWPYAEFNGRRFDDLDVRVSFKEVLRP